MENLPELAIKLLEAVKAEKLSTFQVAEELSALVKQVQELEYTNNRRAERIDELEKELSVAKELNEEGAKILAREVSILDREAKLKENEFKFSIEKTYMEKEVINIKEILSAILARKEINESYYGGNNGSNWNRYENTCKPTFK